MNLNRRKLLSWFGLGWLASLLPSSLVGCSDANSPEAKSLPAPTALAAAPSGSFKAIGTVAQLDKDGQLISDKIAVVRDPKDAKNVLAVNITCTHNGCDVKWKAADKAFVCPCHDAKFAADGVVLQGPANKPLQSYIAKIEKGQVQVRA
jgi:cytochrome b6-f complex iron-sulfur subunit